LRFGDDELATDELDGLPGGNTSRSMSLSYSARVKRRVLIS